LNTLRKAIIFEKNRTAMKKYGVVLVLVSILTMSFTLVGVVDRGNLAQENDILEKIANANGFANWKNVKELKFTFNVDRGTSHSERTWIWKPGKNDITAISATDTLTYNWSKMDSTANKTNAGFINDKYWFLAPYQLMWDKANFTPEYTAKSTAPISKKPMHKLTIVYGNKGGYTPGDAYDFYFGDDYMIKEWVYRKSNQPQPSVITTWEDYIDKGGLKLAQMHKNEDGSFKLHFTNIEVKTN
jgi:hypothetical protein